MAVVVVPGPKNPSNILPKKPAPAAAASKAMKSKRAAMISITWVRLNLITRSVAGLGATGQLPVVSGRWICLGASGALLQAMFWTALRANASCLAAKLNRVGADGSALMAFARSPSWMQRASRSTSSQKAASVRIRKTR
jgi:hypothetical protein